MVLVAVGTVLVLRAAFITSLPLCNRKTANRSNVLRSLWSSRRVTQQSVGDVFLPEDPQEVKSVLYHPYGVHAPAQPLLNVNSEKSVTLSDPC